MNLKNVLLNLHVKIVIDRNDIIAVEASIPEWWTQQFCQI